MRRVGVGVTVRVGVTVTRLTVKVSFQWDFVLP